VNTKLEVHWLHALPRIARQPRGFECCCENLLSSTVRYHTHYLNDKKTIHSLMRIMHASIIFKKKKIFFTCLITQLLPSQPDHNKKKKKHNENTNSP
jgi:hypothetical protein